MMQQQPAYRTVTSADGTSIAYEVLGQGPTLVTVCGATCDRALMRPTAQALGRHFTTVDYDRRGRGDSGDTLPYAVDRELEDLAALIGEVGGPAHLYGHSSGAGLVLRAVAAGLPVDRFVLHDPPYSPDDEPAREEARSFARGLRGLLAEGRHAEAIETFFRGTGMPDEMIEAMRQTPRWQGADLLPEGSHRVLEGQGHVVAPEVLAPVVAEFLLERRRPH